MGFVSKCAFLILSILHWFLLTSTTTVKNHTKAKIFVAWVEQKIILIVMLYYYNHIYDTQKWIDTNHSSQLVV